MEKNVIPKNTYASGFKIKYIYWDILMSEDMYGYSKEIPCIYNKNGTPCTLYYTKTCFKLHHTFFTNCCKSDTHSVTFKNLKLIKPVSKYTSSTHLIASLFNAELGFVDFTTLPAWLSKYIFILSKLCG